VVVPGYLFSEYGYATAVDACNADELAGTQMVYTVDPISNGDIAYTDPGLTTPLNGGNLYYHSFNNSRSYFVNTLGVLSLAHVC
jgi:hypothetical protein